eukprot:gb/GECH01011879.1/.p1 GENE.gb/GECH01011879.1/~~gb/GECH01011879.1/.p1  ORF type:complete len:481 (+),score=122.27 gb/GECH01011879.1/:1-1443(+)
MAFARLARRNRTNVSVRRPYTSRVAAEQFVQKGPQSIDMPSHLLKAPPTQVSALSNGLRIATEEGLSKTATVGIYIAAGSRYETLENNGVAHFSEHMFFKGTPSRNLADMEKQFENMGGHLNAYTSREHTAFTAHVLNEYVEDAVSTISDMIQNPKVNEEDVERERNVILQESREVEQNLEEVMFDQLHLSAYEGHPLSYTILGPEENIKSITRQQIKEYLEKHYVGPRMVLVGSGGISHDQLHGFAEKYLSDIPQVSSQGEVNTQPAQFVGGNKLIHNEEFPMAQIITAMEGPGWASADTLPMLILQQLLGSWDRSSGSGRNTSSSLCKEIATNDLARSVQAFNMSYTDSSLFGVHAVSEPENHEDLMFSTLHNMVKLCFKIRDEDVVRARNQLKTTLLMNQDGTMSTAEDIGRQMIFYGRRMSPAEVFARVDAIDAKTVKDVAMKYIYDRDPVVVGYGPIHNIPDYNNLRSKTYYLKY